MDKIKEYASLCDIQVGGHTSRAGLHASLHAAITGGDDEGQNYDSDKRTSGTDVIMTDKKTVVIA